MCDPFHLIEQAWRANRPIVPLFGAGMSVGAGIPLTVHLENYLRLLPQWFDEQAKEQRSRSSQQSLVDYLRTHGWPQLATVNRQFADQPSHESSAAATLKWYDQLHLMTDGDEQLKDLLFHMLIRGREPSTGHQFAAYLASLMGWRLILTTNFDSLLEQALREHGITPTVFELQDQGRLPDAEVVRTNFSLMKLHGGAFALLTGHILDVPMDRKATETFLEYLPPNALIVVLGYSGADRRVRDLLLRWLRQPPSRFKGAVRLLWIYNSSPPPELNHSSFGGEIALKQYRDGARFLQELYARLSTSHPVATTSYRALPLLPPRAMEDPEEKDAHEPVAVSIFYRQESGYGTSAKLADYVATTCDNSCHVIWCHLEPILTVDALVVHLEREFRQFEPSLPPFALMRKLSQVSEREATPDHKHFEADPRIPWIVEAMRGGNYLIAIDGTGEFGTAQVAEGSRERLAKFRGELQDFLLELIKSWDGFGASRLAVSWTPPLQSDGNEVFLDRLGGLSNAQVKLVKVGDGSSGLQPGSGAAVLGPDVKEAISESCPDTEDLENTWERARRTGRYDDLEAAIQKYWRSPPSLKSEIILRVAVLFRRSRSIVAMRRLVAPLIAMSKEFERVTANEGEGFFYNLTWRANDENSSFDHATRRHGNPLNEVWAKNLTRSMRREIDCELESLSKRLLLVPQHGGFYWMHRIVRETICKELEQNNGNDAYMLGCLHDSIARYYYEQVFRHARDATALFEYIYHRFQSIELCRHDDNEYYNRLQNLLTVLRRERDFLLTQRSASSLVVWIQQIQSSLSKRVDQPDRPNVARVAQDLLETLGDIKAEALRQNAEYSLCIGTRRMMVVREQERFDKVIGANAPDLGGLTKLIEKLNCQVNLGVAEPELVEAVDKMVNGRIQNLCLAKHSSHTQASHTLSTQRLGFRFADHLIDMATCLSESRRTGDIKDTSPETEKQSIAKHLLSSVGQALSLLQTPINIDHVHLLPRLARAQVRCAFRQMEFFLSRVDFWNRDREESRSRLKEAHLAFDRARMALDHFEGWEERDYFHYRCFINCLRARIAYLERNPEFTLAYQHLDDALAAITPPRTGSEKSAVAVCYLHQVECLICHADFEVTRRGKQVKQEEQDDGRNPRSRSWAMLDRARASLARARRLLLTGRPHRNWWAWLFVLEAQLEHEWLLMSLDEEQDDDGTSGHRNARPETAVNRFAHIKAALRAVWCGFDCASYDSQRIRELRILLKQLYLSYLVTQTDLHDLFVNDKIQELFERAMAQFQPNSHNQAWQTILPKALVGRSIQHLKLRAKPALSATREESSHSPKRSRLINLEVDLFELKTSFSQVPSETHT